MTTRYQDLRAAVAMLAADADRQHAHLEALLAHLTPDGDARGYGNDELALELDDSFFAVGSLLEVGQITQSEVDAIRPLDKRLIDLSGEAHADFRRRGALWTDPRWEEVRELARAALAAFRPQ